MAIPPPSGPSAFDPRKQKQKGSGFTNLNKVIDANKGNQLGVAVASGMQQAGQKIQQATSNAADRFNQGLKQNAFGQDQVEERDSIMKKAEAGSVDDQDVAAISRFSAGAYQGPTSLQNKEQLTQDANRAGQIAQGANTQTGRYGLLQQFNPSARYTQGTKRTDALLLGQDSGKLQQSGQALRGLTRGINQQIQSAEGAAKEVAALNKSFGVDTATGLETGMSGITSAAETAQKNAATVETTRKNVMGSLGSDLSFADRPGINNNASRKNAISRNAANLGMSEEDTAYLQTQYDNLVNSGLSGPEAGAQISKIIKNQGVDRSVMDDVSSFMTGGKAAELNALRKLTGKEQKDITNAGKYSESKTEVKDKNLVEGLSRSRNRQAELNRDTDSLQHYITHSKDAQANAISGASQGDRSFFTRFSPELNDLYKKFDAIDRPPWYLKDKQLSPAQRKNAQYSQLVGREILEAQSRALGLASNTIAQNREKSSSYGNLNSIDSYRDYLNRIGGMGTN